MEKVTDLEDLITASPLFQAVDDSMGVDTTASEYPFVVPTAAGRGAAPAPGIADIFGEKEARDAAFEAKIKVLTEALRRHVDEKIWGHEMYEFVQAVNGAMGIAGDAHAGFTTSRAIDDISLIAKRMRSIYALQSQRIDEARVAEQTDVAAKRLDSELATAREALNDWREKVGPADAIVLSFWTAKLEDVSAAYKRADFVKTLFDDNIIASALAGDSYNLSDSLKRKRKAAYGESATIGSVLWDLVRRELYPLQIERWHARELYTLHDKRDVDSDGLPDLSALDAFIKKKILENPNADLREPGTAKLIRTSSLDFTVEVPENNSVADYAADIKPEKLRESINLLYLADNVDAFSESFFSGSTRRAAYALLEVPALAALKVLNNQLAGSQPTDGDDVFGDVLDAISSTEELHENGTLKENAAEVILQMQRIQNELIRDAGRLEPFRSQNAPNQDPVVQFARQTVYGDGSIGTLGKSSLANDFQTFLGDSALKVTELRSKWEKAVGVLALTNQRYAAESIVAVIVCTLMYANFAKERELELQSILARVKEERGRAQRARRDAMMERETLAHTAVEDSVVFEQAAVSQLYQNVLTGDGVGVSNTIVQAMNRAFILVKRSIPYYSDLEFAENIALSETRDVSTAFAQLVATVLRKNQLTGPAIGYVQNVHYVRTKIDMGDSVQLLRYYKPVGGRRRGDRSGRRFVEYR